MPESLKVYKKQCANCLFSDRRIVSPERAEEIIQGAIQEGKYFICHTSSLNEGEVCCSGFYHMVGDKSFIIRLANFLGVVEYVENEKCDGLISYEEIQSLQSKDESND